MHPFATCGVAASPSPLLGPGHSCASRFAVRSVFHVRCVAVRVVLPPIPEPRVMQYTAIQVPPAPLYVPIEEGRPLRGGAPEEVPALELEPQLDERLVS